MLKISAISLVLRIREITDMFDTFDEIYLVFISKIHMLFIFSARLTWGDDYIDCPDGTRSTRVCRQNYDCHSGKTCYIVDTSGMMIWADQSGFCC